MSSETGLLARWAKGGPKLIWQTTTLGAGFSTPAVSHGKIYLLGTRNGKEHVIALDAAAAGKELWTAELGPIRAGGPANYPGPRSTPTVDGDLIYALGSEGDLACLSRAGKIVWHRHLVQDLGGLPGTWGYAESPLIDGDLVVCTPGSPRATLVALNKKTGAVVWKAAVPQGIQAAYSSPIVATVGRVRQYVQFLEGCLAGVDARDGKLLWSYDGVLGLANCSTPLFHEGHVFVTAVGRPGKAGGSLLQLKADKNVMTATEVYRNNDLANQYGGIVLVGGCLYGTNNSELVCVDFKSGQTKWKHHAVGKGCLTAADGHLYLRGDGGPIALVAVSPAGYTEKSRFNPPHRGQFAARAHPVIVDGRLYLRDQDALLCYDLKKD